MPSPDLAPQVRWWQARQQSTGGGAMPRRLRLRHRTAPGGSSGMVFAHGRQRWLVTQREDIPPAEPVDLMAGRITSLAARLRLRLVTKGRWPASVRTPSEWGMWSDELIRTFTRNAE